MTLLKKKIQVPKKTFHTFVFAFIIHTHTTCTAIRFFLNKDMATTLPLTPATIDAITKALKEEFMLNGYTIASPILAPGGPVVTSVLSERYRHFSAAFDPALCGQTIDGIVSYACDSFDSCPEFTASGKLLIDVSTAKLDVATSTIVASSDGGGSYVAIVIWNSR